MDEIITLTKYEYLQLGAICFVVGMFYAACIAYLFHRMSK